ncbi:hypothetical protein ACLKA6_011967 [Drosophila palustris]
MIAIEATTTSEAFAKWTANCRKLTIKTFFQHQEQHRSSRKQEALASAPLLSGGAPTPPPPPDQVGSILCWTSI